MRRSWFVLSISLIAFFALVLVACVPVSPSQSGGAQSGAAAITNLKIGYTTWVGYGPLFIARDQGYFQEEGLNVELVKVEDPKDRFTALAGKQLDGLVSTLDTMTLYWRAETPFVAIFGLDDSAGGDGILVRNDAGIASVADLKGKSIGVNVGSVSHFFLNYVLEQNGLTEAEVTLVRMKQGDVPAALSAAQVDAGVTWEPHLSKATTDPSVSILMTSKETPGLIVDAMILRKEILDANPEIGTKLARAWNKAIDYQKSNPAEAAKLMQEGLGGFYETPDDIMADLAGVVLYDKARNAEFFSGSGAGTALGTTQFAIDLWTELGQLTEAVQAEDMVDGSYLEQ